MYMEDKSVYTYACKIAIIVSKQKIIKIRSKIIMAIITKMLNPKIKTQVNADNIFNKVCPDIKFANNRIEILKTRAIYEINSTTTINGDIIKGVPSGKNKEKNRNLCFIKPNKLIKKKERKEKTKIKNKELPKPLP